MNFNFYFDFFKFYFNSARWFISRARLIYNWMMVRNFVGLQATIVVRVHVSLNVYARAWCILYRVVVCTQYYIVSVPISCYGNGKTKQFSKLCEEKKCKSVWSTVHVWMCGWILSGVVERVLRIFRVKFFIWNYRRNFKSFQGFFKEYQKLAKKQSKNEE